MTREALTQILAEVERQVDVASIQYNGMQIWPLIKKDVAFFYYNRDNPSARTIASKKSKIHYLKSIISSFFKYYKLNAYLQKVEQIYIGAASHRVDLDGNFVNKYYLQNTKEPDKSLSIDYGKQIKGKRYPQDTLFIEPFIPYLKFKSRFTTSISLQGEVGKLKDALRTLDGFPVDTYFASLPNALKNLDAYCTIFNRIFKATRPEVIYSLCYYKNEMFAMHYVANIMSIKNYDIQHGAQGPLHSMYNYNNLPLSGFNTMPESFWVWDQDSYEYLSKVLKTSIYHKVELKGNPWLDYCKERYLNNNIKLSNKKIILYTLQERQLEEYILQAIQNTEDNYEWWIRLHPRMMDAREIIFEQLQQHAIEKRVVIDEATQLPLIEILLQTHVHISKFSGSLIEATLMNTPSIIIDEIGANTFHELINNNKAKLVLEKEFKVLLHNIYTIIEHA